MGGSSSSGCAPSASSSGRARRSKAFYVNERMGKLSDKYTTVRQLGAGVAGEALLVKSGGVHYVAKRTKDMTPAGKRAFLDEFEKMTELQHPHCTKVVELVQELNIINRKPTEQLYVISELALGGDLFSYVQNLVVQVPHVDEGWFAKVIMQAMQGVAFMHAKGIVHNDLKPDNILVMEALNPNSPLHVPWVTVNDFGSATHARQTSFAWGDPRYQSPETWKKLTKVVEQKLAPRDLYKVSTKADVWSMGVTLFELLSGGKLPFLYRHASLEDIMNCRDLWTRLRDGVARDEVQIRPHCPRCSVEAKALLMRMLEKDPQTRPAASEVLECAWFRRHRERTSDGLDCVALNSARTKPQALLLNALVNKMKSFHYEEHWKVFQMVDRDNSGTITLSEFRAAFSQLGASAEDAEAAFAHADVDGDGSLVFTEFMAATFNFAKMEHAQLQGCLEELFHQADDDSSGQVDFLELEGLFGGTLQKTELMDMFSEMDTDEDNMVTLPELIDFLFRPCGEDHTDSSSRSASRTGPDRRAELRRREVPCCLDFRAGTRLSFRRRR